MTVYIFLIVTNEDLLKSQNYNIDTDSSLVIDTSTDSPPGTRNSMNAQSSSRAPELKKSNQPTPTHSIQPTPLFIHNSFEKFILDITANFGVTVAFNSQLIFQ
ncbi:hypothetical protein AVEN_153144-1 [Araneus ventricosus]|uniref:Uncharacterized protein n=1 Tax=Araneus ventricosus TaxID=182803 RepID=A0A4Y2JR05_ARAVE|nr:hypothetical protein AVEN_153144-1 [Araneus ventricosus]